MDDFAGFTGNTPDWESEAKKIAQKYNGKNEVELKRDIFTRAAEGKRNGTLTNEQIDEFYRQIAPMLDSGKRKKLQKLIEQLKSI